jgi:P-type Cu2+ transporter
MVVACPHALGLAVPLVVAVSTSLAAGNGLLIRDRAAFERARNLRAVVFDKTGTLTEGRFGVSDIVLLGRRRRERGTGLQRRRPRASPSIRSPTASSPRRGAAISPSPRPAT